MKAALLAALILYLWAVLPRQVQAQTPLNERVLVVYNSESSQSQAVAKYYMAKRQIPEANRCKIGADPNLVSYDDFTSQIKAPIQKCLNKSGKQKILYIVFSFQTPYSVQIGERFFSVDQFIADIWDEYAGPAANGREAGNHPYFSDAQSQGNAYEPFLSLANFRDKPLSKTVYSVWRLDAATADIARGLVDKALDAEAHGLKGNACFDLQYGPAGTLGDFEAFAGDWDIHKAAEFSKKAGFTVIEDDKKTEFGTPPSGRCDDAALYSGWYSLSHYNDAFTWAPGAIGFHLDSGSATNPRGANNWSGVALQKGITVTGGAITEPYLEGLIHPDEFFRFLFEGANVGDAALRSTRWLKWMIINMGDPLYRPFPHGAGPYGSTLYREPWFAFFPQTVIGGSHLTAAFSIDKLAGKEGMPVTVKGDRPDVVILPPKPMIISEGSNGIRFPIETKTPKDKTVVTVSTSAGGTTLSNTLVVYPLLDGIVLKQLRVKGGATVGATMSLFTPAPSGGALLKLTTSNPSAVVPSEVKVAEGTRSATFSINTKAVSSVTSVDITASFDGASRTVTLICTP
jgi:uncharacterized protein (TIGR03790 family)